MTILYAEDEELTRKNYARYLKRYFDEVIEAKDGCEAFRLYQDKRPDILLLDIDMPGLDGLEVASRIRKEDKKCRIIMLTAIKDTDKLIFAAELNLTKYLPKPINRVELKEALMLAKKQLQSDKDQDERIIISKDFEWHIKSCELFYQNKRVKLTKSETRFFDLLVSNINQTFTQEQIIVKIWGEDALLDYNPSRVKDMIKRLRKKLPINCIENIYSQGYKISQIL